jgi:hypothetical protein
MVLLILLLVIKSKQLSLIKYTFISVKAKMKNATLLHLAKLHLVLVRNNIKSLMWFYPNESSYAPFSKAPIIPVYFMDECHVAKIKGMAEITQVISSICFDKKKEIRNRHHACVFFFLLFLGVNTSSPHHLFLPRRRRPSPSITTAA